MKTHGATALRFFPVKRAQEGLIEHTTNGLKKKPNFLKNKVLEGDVDAQIPTGSFGEV